MTNQLVSEGAFCPNRRCEAHGKLSKGNIIKFGKTNTGVQRYRCKLCGGTFTATRGTLFSTGATPPERRSSRRWRSWPKECA
jgi:hypothetical protein